MAPSVTSPSTASGFAAASALACTFCMHSGATYTAGVCRLARRAARWRRKDRGHRSHQAVPARWRRRRRRVEAFMRGLNRTAPLKFDHPGSGRRRPSTTASLSFRTISARPMPMCWWCASTGFAATVTYTDIHDSPAEFFKSLFEAFDMAWEGTEQRQATSSPRANTCSRPAASTRRTRPNLRAFSPILGRASCS